MKVVKIILIALLLIGIIYLVLFAVKDKFRNENKLITNNSSSYVTGDVAFPITGFGTGFGGGGGTCYDCSLPSTTPCGEVQWEDGKKYDYCVGTQCAECETKDDCTSNPNYGSGYVCVDNSCVPGCEDSSNCPEPTDDYYCDTWSNGVPGTCELYCGDGECDNGEDCNSCPGDCPDDTSCSPDDCEGDYCCMNPGDPGCNPSCSNGGIRSCDPLCGGSGCDECTGCECDNSCGGGGGDMCNGDLCCMYGGSYCNTDSCAGLGNPQSSDPSCPVYDYCSGLGNPQSSDPSCPGYNNNAMI